MSGTIDGLGLVDVFRALNPHPANYTWWSQRGRAWANDVGWRIDVQLATPREHVALERATCGAFAHCHQHYRFHLSKVVVIVEGGRYLWTTTFSPDGTTAWTRVKPVESNAGGAGAADNNL